MASGRFGSKGQAYRAIKRSRKSGGIFGSKAKGTPPASPEVKTASDGQKRVFSTAPKSGTIVFPTIPKANKTSGSSAGPAKSNIKISPARPAENAGATTTAATAAPTSTAALRTSTSTAGTQNGGSRDMVATVLSGAAGAAVGVAGLKIRDALRNRNVRRVWRVAVPDRKGQLGSGPKPKLIGSGTTILMGPGKGAETEKIGSVKPSNPAAAKPQVSAKVPPIKVVVAPKPKVAPKANLPKAAPQEGSAKTAGASNTKPAVTAKTPQPSARTSGTAPAPPEVAAVVPPKDAGKGKLIGYRTSEGKVLGVEAKTPPAKTPPPVVRHTAFGAVETYPPKAPASPPKPKLPTARQPDARAPARAQGSGPRLPAGWGLSTARQPDARAPARAQESPSHAGNDRTVMEAERTRLKTENAELRVRAKLPPTSGAPPENAASAGPKPPEGGKAILRKRGRGGRAGRMQAEASAAQAAKRGGTPLPLRVQAAPTESSLTKEQIAQEQAGMKAEREGAASRGRPGKVRAAPQNPTPPTTSTGPTNAELQSIESDMNKAAGEVARKRPTIKPPKTPVFESEAPVGLKDTYEAKGTDASRKAMIEDHMKKEGYTKIVGQGDEAQTVKVGPKKGRAAQQRAAASKAASVRAAKAAPKPGVAAVVAKPKVGSAAKYRASLPPSTGGIGGKIRGGGNIASGIGTFFMWKAFQDEMRAAKARRDERRKKGTITTTSGLI